VSSSPRRASPPCSADTGCPSTTARRTEIGTVPLRPGHGNLGDRLLRCRLGDAGHYDVGFAIEVDSPSCTSRGDGQPGHGLGHLSGATSPRISKTPDDGSVSSFETGTEVHGIVRRGRQGQRDRGNSYAGPITQANAFAERFVRTVCKDCLDHLSSTRAVTSKRCSATTCATTTRLARIGAFSSRPHWFSTTNHASVRSAGPTYSAASSTSTTELAESWRPVPGQGVQRIGRR